MKRFLALFHSKKAIAALAAILLIAALALGGYGYWLYLQPKFQDLTIELGTETISIRDFTTQYANWNRVRFVTDPGSVTLDAAGDYAITLAQGSREETVTLHVVDTVAPEVEFIDTLVKTVGYVPDAADFVASVEDYAETVAYFAEEVGEIRKFNDRELTVVVEDASGNRVQQTCLLCYTWLAESVTLELGDTLTKEDVLLVPGKGERLVDQRLIDEINASGVGEYTLVSSSGGKKESCTVTVADTTPPELILQQVQIYLNETATMDSFIVSATDNSGEVELRLLSDIPNGQVGAHSILIEAADSSGNSTTASTTLLVKADDLAPVFSGLSDMVAYLHTSLPNLTSGVRAVDSLDGAVDFWYDASGVDMDTAGTYQIPYTASDSSGNLATAIRKLTVKEDDVAPEFRSLTNLYLVVGSQAPDYADGVSAVDNVDGAVDFSFDASGVDYDTPGVYYVVYTAADKAGNTATGRRRVTIKSSATEPDEQVTVFAGDSIMTGMDKSVYNGVASVTIPGEKQVVAYVGLGTVTFRTRTVFDGLTGVQKVSAYNPSRIYIMLGMNEIEYTSVSALTQKYTVLLEELMEACPSADIVVLAVSPVSASVAAARTGFQNIPALNAALERMAESLGLHFYDYTADFADDNGYLRAEYSGGDGIHWKKSGYTKFAELISNYDATL